MMATGEQRLSTMSVYQCCYDRSVPPVVLQFAHNDARLALGVCSCWFGVFPDPVLSRAATS